MGRKLVLGVLQGQLALLLGPPQLGQLLQLVPLLLVEPQRLAVLRHLKGFCEIQEQNITLKVKSLTAHKTTMLLFCPS